MKTEVKSGVMGKTTKKAECKSISKFVDSIPRVELKLMNTFNKVKLSLSWFTLVTAHLSRAEKKA